MRLCRLNWKRICLGFIIFLVVSGMWSGSRVFAQQGATPPPPRAIPANEGERGLVFDGLESSIECSGGFRIQGTLRCTHGPDTPPFTMNVKHPVPPAVTVGNATSTIRCDGDGSSGYRIQALYVRASDTLDRYNEYLASFRTWLAETDLIFQTSAAETGGIRNIRFVQSSDCVPTVEEVVLPATGDDDIGQTMTELGAQGYARTDRKYLVFMDAQVYCGVGTMWFDDSASADNLSNFGPDYARVDAGCWSGSVSAHELTHGLGGVQNSAPNSTYRQNSGGHCTDISDRMCYADKTGVILTQNCLSQEHDLRLDCNHDDYFNTNPSPGSYLATHWNTANNQFLSASNPTCLPELSLTNYFFDSLHSKVQIQWNIAGQNCTNVLHTNVHWDTVSRSPQDASHYAQYTPEQRGGMGGYQVKIPMNGQAKIYFIVHADVEGAAETSTQEIELNLDSTPPTNTPTPTLTPVPTNIPSPTPTATGSSCATKPARPQLVAPTNNRSLKKTRARLDWSDAECAATYRVTLRLGSPKGQIVDSQTDVTQSVYTSIPLDRSQTYYWQVQACNSSHCAKSEWWAFQIK